ncbi:MAG: hypothetical protein AAF585_06105 [Verrucomicrobiota bacterium]
MNSILKTVADSVVDSICQRTSAVDKPRFLLGHDRSGSTWVGSTLGMAKDAIYVHEPVNETASKIGNWTLYNSHLNPAESSAAHAKIYDRAAKGLGVRELSQKELRLRLTSKPTIIIKETGGMLLGEWFQERYKAKIAILFRHPAGVILSNIAMDPKNAQRWFARLISQRSIIEMPIVASGLNKIAGDEDPFSQFAAVYCIRYSVVLDQLKRNPHWLRARYEDLCHDPVTEFRQLYSGLELDWSSEIERKIIGGASSADRAARWRDRIERNDERRIRSVLESFSFPIYNDAADWNSN